MVGLELLMTLLFSLYPSSLLELMILLAMVPCLLYNMIPSDLINTPEV
jgi:hypothetical protein